MPSEGECMIGILGNQIIGPFFIDGNLNAEKYLNLLRDEIIPTLRRLNINLNRIWYQQDGCPAHNARAVCEFLQETFPDKVISTQGFIRWPPRSPDLSLNNFCLWGYLKETIYRHKHERANTLEELCAKIVHATNNIPVEMLKNSRTEFYNRPGYCLAQSGGLFEHLLK